MTLLKKIEASFSWFWRLTQWLGTQVRHNRKRFFISLAWIFFLGLLVNTYVHTFTASVKSRAVDFTIKTRLSSPPPDEKIIILDIDEHSLAALAETQGRWPWPRSVLAEAIATLNEAGAKGIFLNVMLSDPDKNNPNADNLFQYVTAQYKNVAYPLVRLPGAGDASSEVHFSMINGANPLYPKVLDKTLSVLYPYFPATHDTLGISNLSVSEDGILRNYAVYYEEADWQIPSTALRTLQVSGLTPASEQNEDVDILLNWRNKRGDYTTISFADAFAGMNGGGAMDWRIFKDAIVVIGSSAPGISTVKPTAASPVTIDNIIIATAIDDLKNDTYLHQMPRWLSLLAATLVLVTLVFCFLTGVPEVMINLSFAVGQIILLAITVLEASYFNYYIDFTDALLFGMAYFAIGKIYALIDRNATRGADMFAAIKLPPGDEATILFVGIDADSVQKRHLVHARNRLENCFGLGNVLFIDELFGQDHVFAKASRTWVFVVIFPQGDNLRSQEESYAIREKNSWVTLETVFVQHAKLNAHLVKLNGAEMHPPEKLRRFIGAQLIGLAKAMLDAR